MATKAQEYDFAPSRELSIVGGILAGLKARHDKMKASEAEAAKSQQSLLRYLLPSLIGAQSRERISTEELTSAALLKGRQLGQEERLKKAELGQKERIAGEQLRFGEAKFNEEMRQQRFEFNQTMLAGSEERDADLLRIENEVNKVSATLLDIKNSFALGLKTLDFRNLEAQLTDATDRLRITTEALTAARDREARILTSGLYQTRVTTEQKQSMVDKYNTRVQNFLNSDQYKAVLAGKSMGEAKDMTEQEFQVLGNSVVAELDSIEEQRLTLPINARPPSIGKIVPKEVNTFWTRAKTRFALTPREPEAPVPKTSDDINAAVAAAKEGKKTVLSESDEANLRRLGYTDEDIAEINRRLAVK